MTSIEGKFDFENGIHILDVGCGAGQWIMVCTNELFDIVCLFFFFFFLHKDILF